VFRALSARGGLEAELEQELFAVLQAKDIPRPARTGGEVAEPVRSALLALPECYGGAEVLERVLALLPGDATSNRPSAA
jgi:ATP phosphoribosyltransferase regulatory subunit